LHLRRGELRLLLAEQRDHAGGNGAGSGRAAIRLIDARAGEVAEGGDVGLAIREVARPLARVAQALLLERPGGYREHGGVRVRAVDARTRADVACAAAAVRAVGAAVAGAEHDVRTGRGEGADGL